MTTEELLEKLNEIQIGKCETRTLEVKAAEEGCRHHALPGQLVVAVTGQRHGVRGRCGGTGRRNQDHAQRIPPEAQENSDRQGADGGNDQPQHIAEDDLPQVLHHAF